MTRATDTLTTVLQVLDRADAKRAALAPPDAAELVTLAQTLGSAHPVAALTEAAHEVLAGTPDPVLNRSIQANADHPFRWGWKRPATPEACARRLSWRQRLTRWRPGQKGLHIATGTLIGVGMLWVLLTVLIPQSGPKTLFHTNPWAAVVLCTVMIPTLSGLFTLLLSTTGLFEKLENWKIPEELEPDDLPRTMGDYLTHAQCRAYLRHVLQSSLPVLLGGDVARLEAIRHRLDHQAYVEGLAQERRKRETQAALRAQERAAHRPAYLAELAQALDRAEAQQVVPASSERAVP